MYREKWIPDRAVDPPCYSSRAVFGRSPRNCAHRGSRRRPARHRCRAAHQFAAFRASRCRHIESGSFRRSSDILASVANKGVRLLRLRRRGVRPVPIAQRAHKRSPSPAIPWGSAPADCPAIVDKPSRLARFALLERFPDADDRAQRRFMRGATLRFTISSVSPKSVRRSL